MNILTAATIDFANHLREVSKGWRIDPLVQAVDGKIVHNDHVPITPPPPNESYTRFFVNHQPPAAAFTLLRIKIPKERLLRLIQCTIVIRDAKPKLALYYFRAEGFRHNKKSSGWKRSRHPEFNYDEVTVYRAYVIERITRGTKNRGKKRPGKPSIIHRDAVDLSAPESAMKYAIIARATLEKSLDKRLRLDQRGDRRDRLAVVHEGLNFTYDDEARILARVVYE